MSVDVRWGPRSMGVESVSVLYPYAGEMMAESCRASGLFYEPYILEYLHGLALPGLYLDLGAHVGNHSVFFARYCPATAVVAVEAARDMAAILRQNLAKHGRAAGVPCYVVAAAVGMDGRWATVMRGDDNTGAARARLPEDVDAGWAVPVFSVDSIMGAVRDLGADHPVALIKVDVEGCELQAILSAAQTIQRDRPTILAEAAGWRVDGEQVEGSSEEQLGEIQDALQYITGGGYGEPLAMRTPTPTWLWSPK